MILRDDSPRKMIVFFDRFIIRVFFFFKRDKTRENAKKRFTNRFSQPPIRSFRHVI